jgi:16S rRNA (adenine1518-N6/adenine1519-N6)-dimethyltransferase
MMIPPKKSLGQNFLKSEGALRQIIEAGEIKPSDTILEIGPGLGVLTEKILAKAGQVIAVEKDDRLIETLNEKFAREVSSGKLKIVHADILEVSPQTLGLTDQNYKIIANIPYYITGEIFRKFLESNCEPNRLVVLVQKEVAVRITARDSKESILSNSVKCFGLPKIIDTVPRGAFVPAPNVDSAILLISQISKKFFEENKIKEKDFFTILHAGFAHKRKILLGNLKEWLKKDGKGIENNLLTIFSTLNLSEKIRAEDVPLQTWADLAKTILK